MQNTSELDNIPGNVSAPVEKSGRLMISLQDVWLRYDLQFHNKKGSLASFAKSRVKRVLSANKKKNEFWALKGVSFDVHENDVIGVIGRNGAGKSTLVKVIAGIITPDKGISYVNGSVQTLFSLGAGFNPKLSGRENIYLNGCLLGLPRKKIDEKIDEIIEFSGIQKFVDAPLKCYSSGMRVRLGFSIAVHVKSDILLLDEVLGGAGDAAYRKKSEAKMKEFLDRGRTMILISHNMTAVRNLCTKVVWLEQGQVVEVGDTEEVIERYLEKMS